jgi:outer membrane receptor protein involved in Fe transport
LQTDSLIANGFTYSGNVGDGRAIGLETEAAFSVSDHLTLRAHAIVNEPELARRSSSYPGFSDTNLPGAPELSGGASARYERDMMIGAQSTRVFGEIDTTYTGKARLSFSDDTRIGDYAIVSARLGVRVPQWEASFYILNALNSDGLSFAQGDPYRPGVSLVTPIHPRVLGVSLRRNF